MSCNHSSPGKSTSVLVRIVNAPLSLVWSIVRKFDEPELYKRFVRSTTLLTGDGSSTGSIRKVNLPSGLPAHVSIERLDAVDDNLHIISFSIIGGDHRLSDYRSTMLLLEMLDEPGKTIVIESYTVDVPDGNTMEETRFFVEKFIKWNHESLAEVAEKMVSTSSSV